MHSLFSWMCFALLLCFVKPPQIRNPLFYYLDARKSGSMGVYYSPKGVSLALQATSFGAFAYLISFSTNSLPFDLRNVSADFLSFVFFAFTSVGGGVLFGQPTFIENPIFHTGFPVVFGQAHFVSGVGGIQAVALAGHRPTVLLAGAVRPARPGHPGSGHQLQLAELRGDDAPLLPLRALHCPATASPLFTFVCLKMKNKRNTVFGSSGDADRRAISPLAIFRKFHYARQSGFAGTQGVVAASPPPGCC